MINKIAIWFNFLVIFMYLGAGLYVIFSPKIDYIPKNIRVIFGSFLILYGVFRLVRTIYKDRDNEEN